MDCMDCMDCIFEKSRDSTPTDEPGRPDVDDPGRPGTTGRPGPPTDEPGPLDRRAGPLVAIGRLQIPKIIQYKYIS
jgi:hypothetical protein